MDNLNNYFNSLAIQFLNKWIDYVQIYWLYVGILFGLLVMLAWINRENKSCSFFCWLAAIAFVFEPGLYFLIPKLSNYFAGSEYHLRDIYLWSFFAEVVFDTLIVWLGYRYCAPVIESIQSTLTKRSTVERNRKTDIRQIGVYLPNVQKTYAPEKYFNLKRGIFLGLNEQKQPVYIPIKIWRKKHISASGSSGSGKGAISGVVLTQSVLSGDAVVIIDPKNTDEWLPHVMFSAAKGAAVPYVFIDLQSDQPQWNPLENKTEAQIEEMLSAGFGMGEKGGDSDFYRLDDRRAARAFAKIAVENQTTMINTLKLLIDEQPEIAKLGKKFVSDLEEIGLFESVDTVNGVDLAKVIQEGGVIYLGGSMRKPRVMKLQRIFVISIMQIIESRDREAARHVTVFMDEFKYVISRPAIQALGTIRDRSANVMLNFQALGDLRDCPQDLDSDSVVASVNENCSIKLAYAVRDPDTAEWFSKMSGTILVDDEIRQVATNAGLSETAIGERTLRQSERNLIDTNMMQSLPERCLSLFGIGLAQLIFTSPIPVSKNISATTPIEIKSSLPTNTTAHTSNHPHMTTVAESMLDVD